MKQRERSNRKHYYDETVNLAKGETREGYDATGRLEVSYPSLANLVSSELHDGTHLPALDIDFKSKLVPSRTPGHFHLYLDGMRPLSWRRYRKLLKALMRAGVIEPGYYRASKARRATMLRINNV